MKRDFSNESIINVVFRSMRATWGRLRGRVFWALGLFGETNGAQLYFGCSPRFINTKAISIGDRVSFGVMARIECYSLDQKHRIILKIGNNTSFGDYVHIGAANQIIIGSNVLAGSGVLILDHNHGRPREDILCAGAISIPRERPLTSRGPIIIGDNVWIGDSCTILPGSIIGEGAIISTKSIVRGIVPPRTIYRGVTCSKNSN